MAEPLFIRALSDVYTTGLLDLSIRVISFIAVLTRWACLGLVEEREKSAEYVSAGPNFIDFQA